MRCTPLIIVAIALSARFTLAQTVTDPNLKVQTWATGLTHPTGMTFLPDGRALILEKETGQVKILSGKSLVGTALDLPVATQSEEGLLGIALSPTFAQDHFVYLYYTASTKDGGAPLGNAVKRYTLNGSTLTLNKKIIDLPATPGPNHNAGRIAFGPDGKLYIAAGELNRNELTTNHSNHIINPVASILRLNPSGSPVTTNPFYSTKNTGANKALNDIFAYGIRNTFGFDFDPISQTLWETENGPTSFDEINRITPGFNGGWEQILGPTSRNHDDPSTLVSLGPRAHYSDPKFSWVAPVAPTDAFFMPTTRLGAQYHDDLFVATYKGGNILDFNLSPSRKTLDLTGALADDVADNTSSQLLKEQSSLVFGQGFNAITDLEPGPGGMYVLSYNNGIIYRITTTSTNATPQLAIASTLIPEPQLIGLICIAAPIASSRRRRRV
ncbi:MAG TPA: PQQ-dependent sugar dehydrogenase [Tepidisphaeraceae bacterium]|nr:PQQ-dependent sugar dehydrogenase [Tepidisphaeraceae bacterium]